MVASWWEETRRNLLFSASSITGDGWLAQRGFRLKISSAISHLIGHPARSTHPELATTAVLVIDAVSLKKAQEIAGGLTS